MAQLTMGTIINGTIMMGLSTIGRPNIIGSLILKIPGINDILPDHGIPARLEAIKMANNNPNVIPEPPQLADASLIESGNRIWRAPGSAMLGSRKILRLASEKTVSQVLPMWY